MTHENHDCKKRFCENCKENRDLDHLCYMRPMKDALPTAGEKVHYVFDDFGTTQNKGYADKATLQYLTLSVCNSSSHSARMRKKETACDAAS